jgi:hypothetical protein
MKYKSITYINLKWWDVWSNSLKVAEDLILVSKEFESVIIHTGLKMAANSRSNHVAIQTQHSLQNQPVFTIHFIEDIQHNWY